MLFIVPFGHWRGDRGKREGALTISFQDPGVRTCPTVAISARGILP